MDFKKAAMEILSQKIKADESILEIPPDQKLGDIAYPCFILAKLEKKSPNRIAEELSKELKPKSPIKEIKNIGPYVNFFFDSFEIAKETISKIQKEKDNYGKSEKKNKTVMIEYSSPNTNKPLHLGHVRNILLGSSLARIIKFAGYDVIQANLNNDRGIHICKSMLAYKLFGNNKEPDKKSDHFVGDFYVKFSMEAEKDPELEKKAQDMLLRWENGDKETVELWKLMNAWAYSGFEETYAKLGVSFDKYYYESDFYKFAKDIVIDGLKKGLFEKDEKGGIIVNLEKYKLPNKVLLRSDGTSIYITQDIYLAQQKFKEYKLEKSLILSASEQNMHFEQLSKILEILGYEWANRYYHLSYGMVYLPHGRMKSREGTVVDADDLISEIIRIARNEIEKRHPGLEKEIIDERAKKIGTGALKFFMLKMDALKDMHYNPEESISFEGETGAYVQYAIARINSIMKKYARKVPEKIDYARLSDEHSQKIISMLSRWPNTILHAGENYKPSIITRYLLDLSQEFNEFYHNSPILDAADELRDARIVLILCVKQVLGIGLDILGIESVDEM